MNSSPPTLRDQQKLLTRSVIVRKAFELFGRLGFDAVSVEAICEAARISRATFFNYFPQKELLLREIASTRAEKLQTILARFGEGGEQPTFDAIVGLILELCEENARLVGRSRGLVLEVGFRYVAQGPMMEIRDRAIVSLVAAIERIPRRSTASARLVAETLFAIYMATMLEWLIRNTEPASWLLDNMRARLELALHGLA